MKAYAAVLETIARAAESVGRDPAEVTLIAVSKTRTVDDIRALVDLGHLDFGENYVQEALPKIEALPKELRWHFIGALQSNKIAAIARKFSSLHSVDRESHVEELAKVRGTLPVYLQVNLAEDAKKSGIAEEKLDAMTSLLLDSSGIQPSGLMTIGVESGDPEDSRPIFRRLKQIAESKGLRNLSMGMSNDASVAIQEGSTHVRIGTALFGARR